jgi:hypothetical protein
MIGCFVAFGGILFGYDTGYAGFQSPTDFSMLEWTKHLGYCMEWQAKGQG